MKNARLTKYPRVKNARLKVFKRALARAYAAKNAHVTRATGAPEKIKNDRPVDHFNSYAMLLPLSSHNVF